MSETAVIIPGGTPKTKSMLKIRHVPQVWKDREIYRQKSIETRKKQAEKYGIALPEETKLKTASPPITIIPDSFKLIDETSETDHVGTTITATYGVEYYGDWDALWIAANANTLGFPWYGDYASGGTGLIYCSRTAVKWLGGNAISTALPGAFHYTAVFSPITPDRLDLSPLSRPPLFVYGGSDLTERRRYDQGQNPIVNSTGDFFDDTPDFYVAGFECNVTWNYYGDPSGLISSLSFSTNQDAYLGQGQGTGCCGKVQAEETFETYQGVLIQYYRMTAPLRFRTDGNGWNFCPFDYGYRYIDSDGDVVSYIDQKTGAYGPIFLDGSGNLLGGDGSTQNADPVIYPQGGGSGGGSSQPGYQILTPASWGSLPSP